MGTIGRGRKKKEWKNERKGLTLTGLLMEGAEEKRTAFFFLLEEEIR